MEELEGMIEEMYDDPAVRYNTWTRDYIEFGNDLWLEDNIRKRIDLYCKEVDGTNWNPIR